jgi:hypothetical protein
VRSRRTARWLAVLVVLAVLALVLSPFVASTSTPLSPQEAAVAVDLGATPNGWVPVDFGDTQVSVPPSWSLNLDCPRPNGGSMILESVSGHHEGPLSQGTDCAINRSGTSVTVAPYSATATGAANETNGIQVYGSQTVLAIPALGVKVTAKGPLGSRVLRTLTHSPRAILLAPGPSPPVPSSWQRVSYDGISLDVPATWPQLSLGPFPCGGPLLFGVSEVILSSPGMSTAMCPGGPEPVTQPKDGLLLESLSLVGGRLPKPGPCIHIGALSACPTTVAYGILGLLVRVPGKVEPVGVGLGLSGDGMVARTILYSMKPG